MANLINVAGTWVNVDNIYTLREFGTYCMTYEPEGLEVNGIKIYVPKGDIKNYYDAIMKMLLETE